MRVSASRRALLEGLLAAEGPISAEYLASGLGGRAAVSDLPSTYRNLELFERLGLVRHVHIGHGPGLYALVDEGEHSYTVCERCGALARLGPRQVDSIRATIRKASGFEAHFSHFPVLGLCSRCSEAAGRDEGGEMTHHGVDHEHEHSHGDRVHSHPHVHQEGLEDEHEHSHGD